ncbi:DUF2150 domain-containing protein [Halobacteriales archaeon QS_8_65_32]|jgi:hypothetical protein|nr:MAG: DUF2150 domain-containing protein [Halobacteriales archaeon QS_8_65_32]
MSSSPDDFYTEERWQNWIERIEAEEIDPEDEDSARLLLNLQDDAAIAITRVVGAYDEGELETEEAREELAAIQEVVLDDTEIDDEEKAMLIDGVQTSLICVFYAADEYVAEGPADDATVEEYLRAARDAEAEEDVEAALGYCARAGTLVLDGQDIDMSVAEDIEYGLVAEWINGLDSLQSATRDPEVIEEDAGE